MLASVELLIHDENAKHKNRLGILLGNKITETNTLTLTHTLWSLLNLLPAHNVQRPHRHNSVALDLAVKAPAEGAYTLMGPELDEEGWVKNPIRVDWATNGVFVTPPDGGILIIMIVVKMPGYYLFKMLVYIHICVHWIYNLHHLFRHL